MPNQMVAAEIIANRIGPIFDPKFLGIIPQEKLKDIVIIQLKGQLRAMREEAKAVEEIVNVMQEVKLG